MIKKVFLLIMVLIFLSGSYIFSQSPYEKSREKQTTTQVTVPLRLMDDIEENLSKLKEAMKKLEKSQKDLSNNFNEILKNQEAIMKELEMIKYRSFR